MEGTVLIVEIKNVIIKILYLIIKLLCHRGLLAEENIESCHIIFIYFPCIMCRYEYHRFGNSGIIVSDVLKKISTAYVL